MQGSAQEKKNIYIYVFQPKTRSRFRKSYRRRLPRPLTVSPNISSQIYETGGMFGWLCHATYCSVVSTSMLGVSHAVEVLVVGLLLVVCKIPYSSCTFNTAVVVARVILMVSTHVVDIGSDYFVVYLSCVYIYMFGWLPFLVSLLQRLVYHMLSKTRRSSGN